MVIGLSGTASAAPMSVAVVTVRGDTARAAEGTVAEGVQFVGGRQTSLLSEVKDGRALTCKAAARNGTTALRDTILTVSRDFFASATYDESCVVWRVVVANVAEFEIVGGKIQVLSGEVSGSYTISDGKNHESCFTIVVASSPPRQRSCPNVFPQQPRLHPSKFRQSVLR